jgi:putative PIN family toxin of toxin-antitoxin system
VSETPTDQPATEAPRVVFDCPVFAQALISPRGPAGACLTLAQTRRVALYVSPYVLHEIRELAGKLKPRLGVTAERVELLIADLAKYAQLVSDVPQRFVHPVDAGDSPYINLALAANARLVVTRDQHLLALMDQAIPLGQDFATLFPTLRVIQPTDLLAQIAARPGAKP